QARLVAATVDGVRVASVYVPNGQAPGTPKYDYKLAFLARLDAYVQRNLAIGRPFVLCGDYNVAPDDRDVHDPAAWAGDIMCTDAERAALNTLTSRGLTDALRHLRAEPG